MNKLKIYLAASQQPGNIYTGKQWTEEEVMHIYIKDHLAPLLESTGLYEIMVSDPKNGLYDNINQANNWQGRDGLYISHHTNACNTTNDGLLILTSGSHRSKLMATILYEELRKVSPDSDEGIRSEPTFAELRKTLSGAVIIELFYHDNVNNMKYGLTHLSKYAEAEAAAIRKIMEAINF